MLGIDLNGLFWIMKRKTMETPYLFPTLFWSSVCLFFVILRKYMAIKTRNTEELWHREDKHRSIELKRKMFCHESNHYVHEKNFGKACSILRKEAIAFLLYTEALKKFRHNATAHMNDCELLEKIIFYSPWLPRTKASLYNELFSIIDKNLKKSGNGS